MNQSEEPDSEQSAGRTDSDVPEPKDQADVERAPAPKASLTEAELPDLEELLEAAPELVGAVLFDRHGEVLSQAGEVDTEALGRFIVPAQRKVHDTVEELSLGAPERWCLSTDSECWYAIMLGSKRLVAVGEPTKHPATTLRKLPVGARSAA